MLPRIYNDRVVLVSHCIFPGIISACELFEQLALHRVLPSLFLKCLPKTKSPCVSVLIFVLFCGAIYASTSADLNVVSQMRVSRDFVYSFHGSLCTYNRFSLVWLAVMSLFPLSLLMLKFSRRRLRRKSRAPLMVVVAALVLSAVVFGGNIAANPATAGSVSNILCCVYSLFSKFHDGSRMAGTLPLTSWVYCCFLLRHRIKSICFDGFTGHMTSTPSSILGR